MGAKIGKKKAKWRAIRPISRRANWRRKAAEGVKIGKNGKMAKMVGSSIYGVNFVNTEAENGKTSRGIGRLGDWRYKPRGRLNWYMAKWYTGGWSNSRYIPAWALK